jgi:hypothetical protein
MDILQSESLIKNYIIISNVFSVYDKVIFDVKGVNVMGNFNIRTCSQIHCFYVAKERDV